MSKGILNLFSTKSTHWAVAELALNDKEDLIMAYITQDLALDQNNLNIMDSILFRIGKQMTKPAIYIENPLLSYDEFVPTETLYENQKEKNYITVKDFDIDPNDSIVWIDKLDTKFYESMTELLNSTIIGFDCEWRGPFAGELSILQIANESKIFIFDLKILRSEPHFKSFIYLLMSSEKVLKIAQGAEDDFKELNKYLFKNGRNMTLNNYVDLTKCFKRGFSTQSYALKYITKAIFHKELSKAEQLSNWDSRPLRKAQIHYAAMDAVILIKIYNFFKEGPKELKIMTEKVFQLKFPPENFEGLRVSDFKYSLENQIFWIDKIDKGFEKIAEEFLNAKAVGLSAEWKEGSNDIVKYGARVMSLSKENLICVFDLCSLNKDIAFQGFIIKLLESTQIKKVGDKNLERKLVMIGRSFYKQDLLKASNLYVISDIHQTLSNEERPKGIRTLGELYFGKGMIETHIYDWGEREIMAPLIELAALNSCVPFQILSKLETQHPDIHLKILPVSKTAKDIMCEKIMNRHEDVEEFDMIIDKYLLLNQEYMLISKIDSNWESLKKIILTKSLLSIEAFFSNHNYANWKEIIFIGLSYDSKDILFDFQELSNSEEFVALMIQIVESKRMLKIISYNYEHLISFLKEKISTKAINSCNTLNILESCEHEHIKKMLHSNFETKLNLLYSQKELVEEEQRLKLYAFTRCLLELYLIFNSETYESPLNLENLNIDARNIILVDTVGNTRWKNSLQLIYESKLICLDIELVKPPKKKSKEENKISSIIIANDDKIFVFDYFEMDQRPEFQELMFNILSEKMMTKILPSMPFIVSMLNNTVFRDVIKPKLINNIDYGRIFSNLFKNQEFSISILSKEFLGKIIAKSTSNWKNRPLTIIHLTEAAIRTKAILEIHNIIQKNFTEFLPKQYWDSENKKDYLISKEKNTKCDEEIIEEQVKEMVSEKEGFNSKLNLNDENLSLK